MSSETESAIHVDDELLSLAAEVLNGEEFETQVVEVDDLTIVIAENLFFIIAVAAGSTIDQVLRMEDSVVSYLTDRMNQVELGPKVWDAYVILLTQEMIIDPGRRTQALFALNYDTSSVRRIAHAGVEPTMSDVRNALAPFVRPVELDDPSVSGDPFESFVAALIDEGVPKSLARKSVTVFRKGGDIDDVL